MKNLIIESDNFISEITPDGHFSVKSKKDSYSSTGKIYRDMAGQLIVHDDTIDNGAPINGEDALVIEKYMVESGYLEDHDDLEDEDEDDYEYSDEDDYEYSDEDEYYYEDEDEEEDY